MGSPVFSETATAEMAAISTVSMIIGLLALQKIFMFGAVKCRTGTGDGEVKSISCKGGKISMDFGSRQVWL